MGRKLLIVNREQYGYHVDTYKYCEYLCNTFDVTYIGWEREGLKKFETSGVNIKYVSRNGNKIFRYFRFLKEVNNEIRRHKYHLIFFVFFPGCSIIRLLNINNTFVIDIRTCNISYNKIKNFISDFLLTLECSTFTHKTIVSSSLAKALRIKGFHLLPLGGESFSNGKKDFSKLNLLYVGTLHGRNIIECVKGFHAYLKQQGNLDNIDVAFTIIGDTPGNEKKEICQYIQQNNLSRFIKVEGYIHNSLLNKYFEAANIGVSYIPMTKHFDNQPPTKTFEYLLSGLPVIATKTKENAKVVSEGCGILINDNIEDFAYSINELYKKRYTFDSEKIKRLYQESLWEKIVTCNLKPFFLELTHKENHI